MLRTNVRPDKLVPDAGRYTYAVKGTRRNLGGSGVPVDLPRSAPLTVTPATRVGNIICFRTQFIITPKQATTTTLAVRGSDIYINDIDFFGAGQTLGLRPQPPVKAVDGSGRLDWNGRTSGPTTGMYAGSVLGRESFVFEGQRERALGVELRFAFSGELRGSNRQQSWVSLRRGILYRQQVEQKQEFGSEPILLKYTAKLKSFTPR